MNPSDLKIYQLSMSIGDRIWEIVRCWDSFARSTSGKQLVRSADSVAANISEGFGRYSFKENRRFCYYSRGSLYETNTWLMKAHKRGLLGTEEYRELINAVNLTMKMLNRYIHTIGQKR